ncbi:MAG: hypothetical protein HQL25_00225 [Candidatus Omnitrophica bacterium]|nr:hypothetical protein [Candidatus Omnitrophota bacterium]
MRMRTSLIFGLALGVIGLIFGTFLSSVLFVYSVTQFDMYLFHNKAWPLWFTVLWIVLCGLLGIMMIMTAVKSGTRLGEWVESRIKSKLVLNICSFITLLVSLLLLVSFFFMLFKIAKDPSRERPGLKVHKLASINFFRVDKTNQGLDLVVRVDGPSTDHYMLGVDLTVAGDKAKGVIKSNQKKIPLDFGSQDFVVPVKWEDLTSKYAELLIDKTGTFDVEQEFMAQALLLLAEDSSITPDRMVAVIKLKLHCASGKCNIIPLYSQR